MLLLPAIHSLLLNLVDYAGLFPPAALSLSDSLTEYRRYQQGSAPYLLGRFVCGVNRLAELAELLTPQDSFTISGLIDSPLQLLEVEAFHAQVPASVRVDCLEASWGPAAAELSQRWNYWLFFEVKPPQWAAASQLCQLQPLRTGLKLRTGSLLPQGLPMPGEVVDFLEFAHKSRLFYKFTAGLHHALPGQYPLSYASDAPTARLLGFVPLFGLACLHWLGRLSREELLEGLSSDQVGLQVDATGMEYLGRRASPAEMEQFRRSGARSFGSCSFLEPWQELQAMGWIC